MPTDTECTYKSPDPLCLLTGDTIHPAIMESGDGAGQGCGTQSSNLKKQQRKCGSFEYHTLLVVIKYTGMLFKDENKGDNMVDILSYLHQYVPTVDCSDETTLVGTSQVMMLLYSTTS